MTAVVLILLFWFIIFCTSVIYLLKPVVEKKKIEKYVHYNYEGKEKS